MLGSMSLAPRESQRILENSYKFLVIPINSEHRALPLAAPSLSRHLGSIAVPDPSERAWLVASELFFAGEKVCSRYFGAPWSLLQLSGSSFELFVAGRRVASWRAGRGLALAQAQPWPGPAGAQPGLALLGEASPSQASQASKFRLNS